MKEVIYDGTWEGFLCAVFDVYEHKLTDVSVVPIHKRQPSMFAEPHFVNHDKKHRERVWKGLEKKLSLVEQKQVYRAFLSEQDSIEDALLQYIQCVFASEVFKEEERQCKEATTVFQTAKKVWREKHRMKALLSFQRTSDDLSFAIIEPEYDVLPLLAEHFKNYYTDERWLIYDARRRYGMYYDLNTITTIETNFAAATPNEENIAMTYNEGEAIYQQLWQHYFKRTSIVPRKNTKLYIQRMPRRYWKSLPEKAAGGLQERLTNWTYRQAS